jgi:hypothetical protein
MPPPTQYIDIGDIDAPVCRVFSNSRIKQTLSNRLLSLVSPAKWDDPFENFLAKTLAHLTRSGHTISLGGVFRNIFGQCWTTLPTESDAMWRIYSHDKEGVRVKSSPRKLLSAIYDTTHPFREMSFFIGKVQYASEAEIKAWFQDAAFSASIVLDQSGRNQAQALLLKRLEFQHEQEVRLLYKFCADGYSGDLPTDAFHFPIDPNAVFDEMLFDPRMDADVFRRNAEEVRHLGYRGPVDRSRLYQLPDFQINVDA